MDQVVTFGQWLKRRRKALNLTQRTLATHVGVAPTTIEKIEAELRRPSRQTAQRLADALAIASDERERFVDWARGHQRAGPLPLSPPPAAALPWRPLPRPGHTLPLPRDPLIGRETERAAVGRLLTTEEVGLVTLTGAGGVGKTRLALQVAADQAGAFRDGVVFVALEAITDAALVLSTIARVLEVGDHRGQPILERLSVALRGHEVLLVLDNFEQVLPAAPAVATLLRAVPHLTILVTSRAPLHIHAEQVVPVAPLATPDPHDLPDLAALEKVAAVALFARRARAVCPAFVVTVTNASAIAEICARLDGLPLAIELAAARSTLFTPQALVARLSSRLELLTGGAADLPARHHTMHATIAWSYQLLTPAQQRLFTCLAVFVGGWTEDAAATVATATDAGGVGVLDGLQALVDTNLVQVRAGADHAPRFRRFALIREFAQERLAASDDAAAVHDRHAQYFLALAEQAEPELRGVAQAVWLRRLEEEHENLRAVLAWSLAANDAALALRMVGALWQFWLLHGHVTEWDHWLTATLALDRGQPVARAAVDPVRSLARAKALGGRGILAHLQSDTVWTATHSAESLALCRTAGDRRVTATALSVALPEARSQNDAGDAVWTLRTESVRLARQLGDAWLLAWTLAQQAHCQGSLWQHLDLLEEGLSHARSAGDRWLVAWLLHWLGTGVHEAGDHGRARTLVEESLAIRRSMGDRLGVAHSLKWLAFQTETDGVHTQTRAYTEAYLHLEQALGNRIGMADAGVQLGIIAMQQGQHAEARAHFEAALAEYQALKHLESSQSTMLLLGLLAHDEGKLTEALACFEALLPVLETQPDRMLVGRVWMYIGQVAIDAGDLDRATGALETALAIWQDLGRKWSMQWALGNLARAAERAANDAAAAAHWTRCLTLAGETGGRGRLVECLVGLARLAARQGRWERAARLFGAAEALGEAIEDTYIANTYGADNARALAAIRGELGGDVFADACAAGRAMLPEQAIAYALVQSPMRDEPARLRSPAGGADLASTNGRAVSAAGAVALTGREREVLRLVAKGLRTSEVAAALGLSPLTVNVHLRAIYRKLGVRSRTAATRVAIEQQLV